ncbi:hypothetical protein [Pseudanabaena minima]|uniref:hypothetical protein n=1 Tax=Pseudanabaena minima TaxID=890415 RepID=UPI003DA978EB
MAIAKTIFVQHSRGVAGCSYQFLVCDPSSKRSQSFHLITLVYLVCESNLSSSFKPFSGFPLAANSLNLVWVSKAAMSILLRSSSTQRS